MSDGDARNKSAGEPFLVTSLLPFPRESEIAEANQNSVIYSSLLLVAIAVICSGAAVGLQFAFHSKTPYEGKVTTCGGEYLFSELPNPLVSEDFRTPIRCVWRIFMGAEGNHAVTTSAKMSTDSFTIGIYGIKGCLKRYFVSASADKVDVYGSFIVIDFQANEKYADQDNWQIHVVKDADADPTKPPLQYVISFSKTLYLKDLKAQPFAAVYSFINTLPVGDGTGSVFAVASSDDHNYNANVIIDMQNFNYSLTSAEHLESNSVKPVFDTYNSRYGILNLNSESSSSSKTVMLLQTYLNNTEFNAYTPSVFHSARVDENKVLVVTVMNPSCLFWKISKIQLTADSIMSIVSGGIQELGAPENYILVDTEVSTIGSVILSAPILTFVMFQTSKISIDTSQFATTGCPVEALDKGMTTVIMSKGYPNGRGDDANFQCNLLLAGNVKRINIKIVGLNAGSTLTVGNYAVKATPKSQAFNVSSSVNIKFTSSNNSLLLRINA